MVDRIEDASGMVGRVEDMSSQINQLQKDDPKLDNNNHNSAAVAANADGSSRSARERQMQKLELGRDVATWRKTGSQRHWCIRGRAPPNMMEETGDDLQALSGDMLEVTAEVAQ